MLFFTHTRSTKASEIDANLRAALVFLWSASGRQVRAPHCIGRPRSRSSHWLGRLRREPRRNRVPARSSGPPPRPGALSTWRGRLAYRMARAVTRAPDPSRTGDPQRSRGFWPRYCSACSASCGSLAPSDLGLTGRVAVCRPGGTQGSTCGPPIEDGIALNASIVKCKNRFRVPRHTDKPQPHDERCGRQRGQVAMDRLKQVFWA